MDEQPKSIWKKQFAGRTAVVVLALLIALGVFLVAFIYALANWEKPVAETFVYGAIVGIIFLTCCLFILFVLLPLSRWLFWKHWRRTLFSLACFATLIALFYAEEDWRGWHAWNQFKHEWEAKGEHFDFASVVPPPVPDEQNFALTPVVASSYEWCFDKKGHEVMPRNTNVVDRLSMITWRDNHWTHEPKSENWQTAQKTDLKAWQEFFRSPPPNSKETNSFPVAPLPQTPAADILLALSKYDSAIEEVRQASQLPYSRFPLVYDQTAPFAILLPHLAAVKSCAQAVSLRTLAELQNGQSEKAVEDVKLSLYLAGSIRTEPFLISHLVRIAMLNMALQPIYEGLAEHQWSDRQLVAFDAELEKLSFLADFKLSMRGEMGLQGGVLEYLRRQPEQFMNFSADNYSGNALPFPARMVWQLIPSGWFYQNQFRCDRMIVEWNIPLVDVNQHTISPAAVRHADGILAADIRTSTVYNLLERMLIPPIGGSVEKFAHQQSSVDLARTAIALERYRLAHGEFPETLDVLAPQFIAKVPHDVIGGQPLKYRRSSDGQFVLYSVGWNEQDDGGMVVNQKSRNFRDESSSKVDISQGDWVWRYPQK